MKSDLQHDLFINILVGIAGAIVGGFVMSLFGQDTITGINFYSFIVALIGAVIFIAFIRMLRRPYISNDKNIISNKDNGNI